jgi:hypothetical protein
LRAVRCIAWLDLFAWKNLERLMEGLVMIPRVSITVSLYEPDDVWLAADSGVNRPNLSGPIDFAGGFVAVVAHDDVPPQPNRISDSQTAGILPQIVLNQPELALSHRNVKV